MSFFGELARIAILAQEGAGKAPPAAGGGGPAGAAPGGNPPGPGGILEIILGPAGFVVVMVTLFWFMIIRPQQQRETDHEKMLDELKVYDKVVTIGGILGTITDIRKNEDVVTLRIDEKSRAEIRVLKSHISRPEEEEDDEKKKDKDSEKKSA